MGDETAMNENSHQLLSSIWEKVADIDKDVDELIEKKGNAMSNDNMVPAMMMGMQNQWMNNPFMYLVMLAWMNNGGFGFGGNGAAAAAVQNSQDTNLLMNSINNASATNQRDFDRLAGSLGTAAASINGALCGINNSITQLMGQSGIQSQAIINAVQQGFAADQLQICQQTNALQKGQADIINAINTQATDAQLRSQADTIDQLRDQAQTATLLAAINNTAAARTATASSGS